MACPAIRLAKEVVVVLAGCESEEMRGVGRRFFVDGGFAGVEEEERGAIGREDVDLLRR